MGTAGQSRGRGRGGVQLPRLLPGDWNRREHAPRPRSHGHCSATAWAGLRARLPPCRAGRPARVAPGRLHDLGGRRKGRIAHRRHQDGVRAGPALEAPVPLRARPAPVCRRLLRARPAHLRAHTAGRRPSPQGHRGGKGLRGEIDATQLAAAWTAADAVWAAADAVWAARAARAAAWTARAAAWTAAGAAAGAAADAVWAAAGAAGAARAAAWTANAAGAAERQWQGERLATYLRETPDD